MWEKCPNPKCDAKNVRRLIAPAEKGNGTLYCSQCYNRPIKKFTNCNLGQSTDTWVGADGKTHRVTVGKKWEIEHRRIAEDGMTIINHATGKETQY